MREQIMAYLQYRADRISKMTDTAPAPLIEEQTDKLLACMEMGRVLLDADEVTVDGNWKITIKGGR